MNALKPRFQTRRPRLRRASCGFPRHRFRSRFDRRQLEHADRKRAVEAADIINRFQDEYTYPTFLSLYTPMTDPFVHEVRVHLFRRDRYFNVALEHENDPQNYNRYLTIALRENQIVEKYFHHTLHHSNYIWSEEKLVLARQHLMTDEVYDSWVSRRLITRIREWPVVCLLIGLIFVLTLFHWFLGKSPESKFST